MQSGVASSPPQVFRDQELILLVAIILLFISSLISFPSISARQAFVVDLLAVNWSFCSKRLNPT